MSRRSNKPSSYTWGSEVICLSRGAYYEARIIKIEQRDDDQTLYRVHYKGWSQTYGRASYKKSQLVAVGSRLKTVSTCVLAASRWDEYVEEDKLMHNTSENQQKAREFNGAPRLQRTSRPKNPARLTLRSLPCACRLEVSERVKQELAQAQAKRRAASGATSTPAREKAASEEPGSGADQEQGAHCGRGRMRLLAHTHGAKIQGAPLYQPAQRQNGPSRPSPS